MTHAGEFLRLALNGSYTLSANAYYRDKPCEDICTVRNAKIDNFINNCIQYLKNTPNAYEVKVSYVNEHGMNRLFVCVTLDGIMFD